MPLPLAITKRPFAVEPVTGVMLPDGIFDAAIHRQLISCHITNVLGHDILSGFVRIPQEPVPGVFQPAFKQINFGPLKKGASLLVQWLCDFSQATPGKYELKVEFGGSYYDPISQRRQGFDGFIPQKIFVSKTTFDANTRQYICEVPEGRLSVRVHEAEWGACIKIQTSEGEREFPGVPVPLDFTATWTPFPGHELDLPFQDPWWKTAAWVVFAIAAIAAVIAASTGNGSVGIGLGGYDNQYDQYRWCFPDGSSSGGRGTAGVFSDIASFALTVGCADDVDPWQRGRVAAHLHPGELPVEESVRVKLSFPQDMRAGTPYAVGADWTYNGKFSSGRAFTHSVKETRTNTHTVKRWELDVPKVAKAGKPIVVRVKAHLDDGSVLSGDELYGYAQFESPGATPKAFRAPLLDDGLRYDSLPGDGWFSAYIHIEELIRQYGPFPYLGEWKVSFFAQDINDATSSMSPLEAATHIGGAPILASFTVARSGGQANPIGSCPADRVIRFLVEL